MESSQRPLTLIFLTGAATSQSEQNRGTLKRLNSLQFYHLACLIVYTVVENGGLWAPRILQSQLNSDITAMRTRITGEGQSEPVASCSCSEILHRRALRLPMVHTPVADCEGQTRETDEG